jgi:hypothetical protein
VEKLDMPGDRTRRLGLVIDSARARACSAVCVASSNRPASARAAANVSNIEGFFLLVSSDLTKGPI